MIINETAYEAGKQRAIKLNARKTGRAKWLAAHDDAQRLYNWLNATGEFADKHATKDPADQTSYDEQMAALWKAANEQNFDPHADVWELDERFDVRLVPNPMTQGMFSGGFGDLLLSMRDNLDEWGGLTEKQTAMVRKALARKEQWVAEADAKKAARAEELKGSKHVGEVKQRMVFELTVNKVLSFEGRFGTTFINLCEDADGNQIVYKGTNCFNEGPLTVKATVKAHETRDGVAQTLIARPAEV